MSEEAAWAEAGEDFRGVVDWQDAAAAAVAAGSPLQGLPRGLRVRATGKSSASKDGDAVGVREGALLPKVAVMLSVRDMVTIGLFIACGLLIFVLQRTIRSETDSAPTKCKQCRQDWWNHFWEWRFEDSSSGKPLQAPEGMEWEWDHASNHTDWFGVSAQLIDEVVSVYVDPKMGPVLHIGCGDSPLPELLYRAGYHASEHLDIVPQVVAKMQHRYPLDEWPGMVFSLRDFLGSQQSGGGPPLPLHRFALVIDKAGIWDWLQDEAPERLPLLLERVRDSLVLEPRRGLYIIVTKQNPFQFSETLANIRASYTVEASRPLGNKGVAWSYVLEPL